MKKVGLYSLLFLTCAFIILIAGIFIGRSSEYHLATHSEKETRRSEETRDELFVYSDEIYIDGHLNINAAGKEDISQLPGIGDTLTQRIIAYRQTNGPFKEIDDLLLVEGMGPNKLDRIRDYITIGKMK